MTLLIPTKPNIRLLFVVLTAALVSACSSTQVNAPKSPLSNRSIVSEYYQLIDSGCAQQAMDMDSFAQQSGQPSQYLAAAKAMLRCVDGIQFAKGHPNADQGLRMMAIGVLNLVKGGDLHAAQKALRKAQAKFPHTDLYFADYSSFFDTASALINQQKLTGHQLAGLNISAELRAEIERHQYWLSH